MVLLHFCFDPKAFASRYLTVRTQLGTQFSPAMGGHPPHQPDYFCLHGAYAELTRSLRGQPRTNPETFESAPCEPNPETNPETGSPCATCNPGGSSRHWSGNCRRNRRKNSSSGGSWGQPIIVVVVAVVVVVVVILAVVVVVATVVVIIRVIINRLRRATLHTL